MRLGISPFASTRDGALQLSQRALEGGLQTLWLGDGLLVNPDFPGWSGAFEPFTELAWLAGRFPSAALGLTAAVLPLRDMAWLVKQAATLDHLTEGRFVLAVAPGFWEHELRWRGIDFADRGAAFAESLAALRAGFAGEAFAGRWTHFPAEGRLAPVPFTRGGPPLWLAGGAPTMQRALQAGLPFQVSRVSPDALAPVAKKWFDGGGSLLGVRARIEVADAVPQGEGVAWNALAGPPAYLAEQLAGFAELGVADVSIVPGQGDDASLRTVDALAEFVVPTLRASGIVA